VTILSEFKNEGVEYSEDSLKAFLEGMKLMKAAAEFDEKQDDDSTSMVDVSVGITIHLLNEESEDDDEDEEDDDE